MLPMRMTSMTAPRTTPQLPAMPAAAHHIPIMPAVSQPMEVAEAKPAPASSGDAIMQLTEKVADLGLQPTCSNALAQPVDNLPELLEVLFTACLVF